MFTSREEDMYTARFNDIFSQCSGAARDGAWAPGMMEGRGMLGQGQTSVIPMQ